MLRRRIGTLLTVLLVLIGLTGLAGCQSGQTATPAPPASPTTAGGGPAQGNIQTGKASVTKDASGKITVTDFVGRTVTLNGTAKKVFGAGPPATTILYTFQPSVMAGWNAAVSEAQKPYIDPSAQGLPVMGRVTGGQGTFNPEVLIQNTVDLVMDAGDVSERYAKSAQDLQDRAGVPVIQMSSDPRDMAKVYEILGVVTGHEDRAKELTAETERLSKAVADKASSIPADKKVRVYYATGDTGLKTTKGGSIHSRAIEMVGAENAMGQGTKLSGQEDTDAEAVIKANPDWVVINVWSKDAPLTKDPTADPQLGGLKAFKDGKYLVSPSAPYGWFDGPPSVNQTLGIVWLAESLYPDVYDFDLLKETRSFYKVFYHTDITEQQAKDMLHQARTPGF